MVYFHPTKPYQEECLKSVVQFIATCFSLFPDAGMADLLGALDSRNDGEQKCLSR
jgi:hypothetical protein